ncbi:hypothetical protein [Polynucleobacter sp. UK-Kesae-W10]|uniref:hypothetical protein n=1 Tax=Polynucleobacter sp. UK-Kesae-W10 TaxID=1819738 RepID=UPI001C0C7F3E|nr:hypothetical protein [Polynucleobacter sp. UK-Kesae-W10]MBU3577856.1 hypothetical protein [Polynucleobacter sp. UK-Kesae-W10]
MIPLSHPVKLARLQTLVSYCLIASALLFQGCAAPLVAIGSSTSAAASTAGSTVAAAAVANPITATSIASTATTGKSPLEHAASAATKKECSFLNVVGPKPICEEITLPPVTDYSTPLPGPLDTKQESAKQ